MKSLADSVKGNIDHKFYDSFHEHFHEFLWSYKNIFTNNIYVAKGYIYDLAGMIQNKDIVVV